MTEIVSISPRRPGGRSRGRVCARRHACAIRARGADPTRSPAMER